MKLNDEREFRRISRRELLKLSPLALAGLIAVPRLRDSLFMRGLEFSDWASSHWFRGRHLAPTYPDSQLGALENFFVNTYDVDDPGIDLDTWSLSVSGLVRQPGQYRVADLQRLPLISENVRHVCVEGWDFIGNFAGARISDFLRMVGGDTSARFLYVECADGYYESLDMATALHPQSLLCYQMYGQPLQREHGAPVRLYLPTKIGYKSAKYLTALSVTNVVQRRGYWEDQGYDWFYSL
ncbi:MAG TPA: molybdopterin-dependent oxidoreductase [Terriglobales bacterium]|nr:molybdopterin-dependent oxidoreductase [Terriglobales bacterium]